MIRTIDNDFIQLERDSTYIAPDIDWAAIVASIRPLMGSAMTHKYEKQITCPDTGLPKQLILRAGNCANAAFIDQLSFTCHRASYETTAGRHLTDDADLVVEVSMQLMRIFGFGITEQFRHSGGRYYRFCFKLGTDECLYGRVHLGDDGDKRQADTVLVELTAAGCGAAMDGWESRLYDFLKSAVRPNLTRVDLTRDFFDNSQYSCEKAFSDWQDGLYTTYRARPKVNPFGYGWHSDDVNAGKTLYIGTRESGKYVRVYDKAAEYKVGDQIEWTRMEVELRSKSGYKIPLDVLIDTGSYFAGLYPVCESFAEMPVKRIDAVNKKLVLSWDKAWFWARQQVGSLLNAVAYYYPDLSAEDVLKKLKAEHKNMPKRLNPAQLHCSLSDAVHVHEYESDFKEFFKQVLGAEKDAVQVA